jgi:phosphoglucosamine mutase
MSRLPQVLVNCRVSRKDGWEELPAFKEALQDAYTTIGPYGRVLVRPSGTEPLMRVMVEGKMMKQCCSNWRRNLRPS